MTKIRIAVDGWQTYTGYFGPVLFRNGVSVDHVSDRDIRQIGSNIRIEDVDSDEQLGVGVDIVNSSGMSAEVVAPVKTEEDVENEKTVKAAKQASEQETDAEIAEEDEKPEDKYTREQLEAIADADGIKGVRVVAAKFGVKGVGINEIIDEILAKQEAGV